MIVSTRNVSFSGMAVALMTLVACGPQEVAQPTVPTEAAQPTDPTAQRVADLVQINALIQQYHATNGSYPVSNGMQGYATNWGGSLGLRWIPELAQDLPRDPNLGEAGTDPQYLYSSDGMDYKLIAHATGDCSPSIEGGGIRIDPSRQDGNGCWAYGFWSEGGARF